ncbi:MAG: glutamine amidotransferase [Acidobacteriota bacterium]
MRKILNNERPLLIIKTGSAIHQAAEHGDFEDWIVDGMNLNGQPVCVCRVDKGEDLPEAEGLIGVVITGSPAMVTERLNWSEKTAEWLRGAVPTGLPILGICFGHQLLAHALGGRVSADPAGREIGTVEVRLDSAAESDLLFRGIPPVFLAQATHEQSVIELPAESVALAESPHPANHAFRVGPCAWGVQFHPEFDDEVMESYLSARAPVLREEGLNPECLLDAVRPAPVAAGVLRRFSEIVFG